jgi:hypothetical protein
LLIKVSHLRIYLAARIQDLLWCRLTKILKWSILLVSFVYLIVYLFACLYACVFSELCLLSVKYNKSIILNKLIRCI